MLVEINCAPDRSLRTGDSFGAVDRGIPSRRSRRPFRVDVGSSRTGSDRAQGWVTPQATLTEDRGGPAMALERAGNPGGGARAGRPEAFVRGVRCAKGGPEPCLRPMRGAPCLPRRAPPSSGLIEVRETPGNRIPLRGQSLENSSKESLMPLAPATPPPIHLPRRRRQVSRSPTSRPRTSLMSTRSTFALPARSRTSLSPRCSRRGATTSMSWRIRRLTLGAQGLRRAERRHHPCSRTSTRRRRWRRSTGSLSLQGLAARCFIIAGRMITDVSPTTSRRTRHQKMLERRAALPEAPIPPRSPTREDRRDRKASAHHRLSASIRPPTLT